MKILKLTAENIKKLKVVEIEPHGNVVQVTGRNGSGKSSTLDAIWWALAGGESIQGKPIREGEETARIRLDLGDLIVERKFTAKGTTLTVQNADGAKYSSPQKMLDALVGSLSFDPLEFSRMPAKEQFNLLRQFVASVDFDAIDAARATDYANRTAVNKEAKQDLAAAQTIVLPEGLPDVADDESALVEKLKNAADTNSEINARAARRVDAQKAAESCRNNHGLLLKQIEALRAQIVEREAEAVAALSKAEEIESALASAELLPPLVDTSEVQKQIEAARVTNSWLQKKARKAELLKRAEEKEAESALITRRIEERDEAVKKAIAEANLPLQGLGLGDGIVTMNGIPFDQLSSAEQLRASVAITMAANPKLRVIRIKDGSLLDDNGLEIIRQAATDKDFQVWVESVDTSGKVGVYMEDGEVVAVNE